MSSEKRECVRCKGIFFVHEIVCTEEFVLEEYKLCLDCRPEPPGVSDTHQYLSKSLGFKLLAADNNIERHYSD